MATVNIRRDVSDPFYRYKMERIQSKIEGKGNGIKTVIVNLSAIAQALARPPSSTSAPCEGRVADKTVVIKYFGFELGAQTNTNPTDDRWIINGAHDASKLQDYLDGFISRFVLCRECKNPETEINVKDGRIFLDCKAGGELTDVDLRLKLSSFILKSQAKKGKKDKSTKKAERRARKEAGAHHGDDKSPTDRSPAESDSPHDDGEVEVAAGSDDEFTRRITADAQEIEDAKDAQEIQWSVDTSEAAVKARAKELPSDLKSVVLDDDEGAGDSSQYDQFGQWVMDAAQEKGDVGAVGNVDIYLKAQKQGIEGKHRTLTVLAQTLFDERIVAQLEQRREMLAKMITSERHEKAFLGGMERFVGTQRPELIPKVSKILLTIYENDLVTEDVLKAWGGKASKKYVDLKVSKQVRKSADQFMTWLNTAESDDSE